MPIEHRPLTLQYGGLTKQQLRDVLSRSGIRLNLYAQMLFDTELFVVSTTHNKAIVAQLSIQDLGFENGTTFYQLLASVERAGFHLCPLELGPYLRLKFVDQEEEFEGESHKAPKGSLTILSDPLIPTDDSFPKGFYLRKIDGTLWLRGYCCSLDYVWAPTDRIAVLVDEKPIER